MEQLKPKLLYWFPVKFYKMQIFPPIYLHFLNNENTSKHLFGTYYVPGYKYI